MDGTVLIADDDRTIRTVLTQALTRSGCKVHATSSMQTLLRWIEEGKGDLVISDVMMPDGNGLESVPKISDMRPNLPVIIISAQNTISTAIKAAEVEAYDYLPKPFDLPDLMKRAAQALSLTSSEVSSHPSNSDFSVASNNHGELPLIGQSNEMQNIYRIIARIINVDISIVITGESGTGKSLIARAIHDYSPRREKPFVILTSERLENLGIDGCIHEVGSGTLLFDDISDFSEESQASVIRLLDSIPENTARIIATFNESLQDRLAAGTFRKDLYYRLAGMAIDIPPLRSRIDDIILLCDSFLVKAHANGLSSRKFSEKAVQKMRSYNWPGNVRQLENTINQLCIASSEPVITLDEVVSILNMTAVAAPQTLTLSGADNLSASVAFHLKRYFDLHGGELPSAGLHQRVLREVELPLIEITLDAVGGKQAKCAEILGLNRNTLRKKIKELDIEVTRRRKML